MHLFYLKYALHVNDTNSFTTDVENSNGNITDNGDKNCDKPSRKKVIRPKSANVYMTKSLKLRVKKNKLIKSTNNYKSATGRFKKTTPQKGSSNL